MVFQNVVFLFFIPHFLRIVVDVNAPGQPHVLGRWLWTSKGMLTVEYVCSSKSSFCVSLAFL